ncbi:MAG: right-handed parallel beta-helix repeat-containing protein, partial [Deltaproteobacteria bacterium]|nr:right-handed parallel beta-helix repeat-containing protein [Deltaproteobacteria bacterium]
MSLTIRGLLVVNLFVGALAFALTPTACSESEEQTSSTSGSGGGGAGGLGGGGAGGASNGGGGGGGGTPLPETGFVLFADQDLVIPEVAAAGDTVGHAKTSPTVTLADPTFEIIAGDDAARFVMGAATGLITVAEGASFDAATEATIPLTVRVGEPGLGSNTAVVTVHVLAAATTVFIDPENGADTAQDGSIDHPYDSFTDFSITAGYAYLLKRGTQTNFDGALEIGVSDLLIGAYGSGGRPYFEASSNSHAIYNWSGPQNVTVRDLEIHSAGDSCVRFGGATGANETIDNIVCHGPGWGVRAFTVAGLTIVYSEIYDIRDDGIFTAENTEVEIAFNDIHDVNQNWVEPYTPETQAGGDAIQFVDNNQWHV